jgi:hypothetical protein
MKSLKYSEYLKETRTNYRYISYNLLNPPEGARPGRIDYTLSDALNILVPYIRSRWNDQMRVVMPITLYLVLFQVLVLRQKVSDWFDISIWILTVILGLMLFMEGLKVGLMPFGETIGYYLPIKSTKMAVLSIAFLLGVGATLAEPALNALGMTVENLTNGAFRKRLVMISVSLGVALGVMVGVIKMIFNIPLVWLIVTTYMIALVLTIIAEEKYVNLGWDSAGVTTGPITVPLVIAMGLGFANASGAVDGFGILSMASVFPIISVLFVGIYVHWMEKRKGMEDVI